MTYQEEFITFMVRSGVLTFGDFTTKSGRKTPYFINTGNYKTGAQAARLGDYYAACLQDHLPGDVTALFGPAYKGIPLAVSAAASLYRNYGRDLPYCFNRKEVKDHGEGGSMVGYQPKDGDVIAIVEDVVTAGTAVRESIALFKNVADVTISSLFVSVDRMERGSGTCSTLDERSTASRSIPSSRFRISSPSSTTGPSMAKCTLTAMSKNGWMPTWPSTAQRTELCRK